MPETQTLNAALSGAIVVLSGAVAYLYRENQKLHCEMNESTKQMLRVLVVTEKALDKFEQTTNKLLQDSTEIRETITLLRERQAAILAKLSAKQNDKSNPSLPR